jgi:hypothetical protein
MSDEDGCVPDIRRSCERHSSQQQHLFLRRLRRYYRGLQQYCGSSSMAVHIRGPNSPSIQTQLAETGSEMVRRKEHRVK